MSRAELDKQAIHITSNLEANQVKMGATFVAWNFLSFMLAVRTILLVRTDGKRSFLPKVLPSDPDIACHG